MNMKEIINYVKIKLKKLKKKKMNMKEIINYVKMKN